MRFDQSFLDEIRARLPVSEVVARAVKLKRQGREFIGLSPFKQEKTPSFTVNDQKGFYHCFATGEHGDIFKFLQVTEGLAFPEAVERLAREAGLEMPKVSPQAAEREQVSDRLRAALEAACGFFEETLRDTRGGRARTYLDRRGMARETQAIFRVGYAGKEQHALKEHLATKGFSQDDMALAGLIIAGDDIAVSYDRFRDRVMFPIRDTRERVIAFGGRALSPDAKAKYINSPETPLFHKGHVLFNAGPAREAAWKAGSVIVAEGYIDVIALHQAGFANAVAPLGTALTEEQVKLLWRMSDEPVLCFDGDEAGRKAAFRAVDTALALLEPGKSLKFCFLPGGQDPDDLIAAEGAGAFRAVLEKAEPMANVLWAREVAGGTWNTPERRAALEDRLAGLLKQIRSKRVRRHYAQAIAEKLRQLWGAAEEARRTGGGRGTFSPASRGGGRFRSRAGDDARDTGFAGRGPSESLKTSSLVSGGAHMPSREALLLRTLLNHPWMLEANAEEIAALELENRALTRLRDEMLNLMNGDKELDSAALRNQLSRMETGAIVDQLDRAITHKSDWFAEPGAAHDDVETGWRQLLVLHRRAVELKRELDAAELAWQAEESESALARLVDIRQQLLNLEGTEAIVEGYGADGPRAANG